ncbi:hypothetical protein PsorP6_016012 [Peronosclerospora sorghi]|uniref:Uncharacterized protein n=1 Tax=Peronosclerospora sorghi TaxID=230839 RepID=A0ACC0WPX6_9STRA|nr:hypothetical protein PsorP6_016012 [Peronosclerospora sorghi]
MGILLPIKFPKTGNFFLSQPAIKSFLLCPCCIDTMLTTISTPKFHSAFRFNRQLLTKSSIFVSVSLNSVLLAATGKFLIVAEPRNCASSVSSSCI